MAEERITSCRWTPELSSWKGNIQVEQTCNPFVCSNSQGLANGPATQHSPFSVQEGLLWWTRTCVELRKCMHGHKAHSYDRHDILILPAVAWSSVFHSGTTYHQPSTCSVLRVCTSHQVWVRPWFVTSENSLPQHEALWRLFDLTQGLKQVCLGEGKKASFPPPSILGIFFNRAVTFLPFSRSGRNLQSW